MSKQLFPDSLNQPAMPSEKDGSKLEAQSSKLKVRSSN